MAQDDEQKGERANPTDESPSHKIDDVKDQSRSSTGGATGKVESAFRDTMQSYLDRMGIKFDMHGLEDNIVDKPLLACGIAVAACFIVAGGMSTSLGSTILGWAGRKAVRDLI
jgi:hypothetical protein